MPVDPLLTAGELTEIRAQGLPETAMAIYERRQWVEPEPGNGGSSAG